MNVVDYTEFEESEFPIIKSITKGALRSCGVTMEQYEDYIGMIKKDSKLQTEPIR